jgi:hypothetical protein
MNNKKSTESEYDRIINLFKDEKGLITATLIREKGIARDQDSEYRRNLLRQVIDRKEHAAWSNGRESTDNKYGIYFNIDDSSGEYLFTPYLLFTLSRIEFPLLLLISEKLTEDQSILLSKFQHEYVETCKAFCRYQGEKNVVKNDLPEIWDKDIKDFNWLKIKMYIQMYKTIKLDWEQIKERHFEPDDLPDITHDDLFRTILHSSFIREFENSISLSQNKVQHQSRYNYFLEIMKARKMGILTPDQYGVGMEAEKIALENAMKLLSDNLGSGDWLSFFTAASWIQEIVGKSEDPLIKTALKDWLQSETDLGVFATKLCRRTAKSNKCRPSGGWTNEGSWLKDLAKTDKQG